MPVIRYKLTGKAIGLYIGTDPSTLVTTPQGQVNVLFGGFDGDQHAGITRPSDSRTPFYPRGTEIRNSRQVSIVSIEELERIAGAMDLPEVRAEWLGANVLTQGIPNLSFLPAGTRLFFENGATLIVQAQNRPCKKSGKVIQEVYDQAGLEELFPQIAQRLRGVVACVEKPGLIHQGETIQVEVPEQFEYRLEPYELT